MAKVFKTSRQSGNISPNLVTLLDSMGSPPSIFKITFYLLILLQINVKN